MSELNESGKNHDALDAECSVLAAILYDGHEYKPQIQVIKPFFYL